MPHSGNQLPFQDAVAEARFDSIRNSIGTFSPYPILGEFAWNTLLHRERYGPCFCYRPGRSRYSHDVVACRGARDCRLLGAATCCHATGDDRKDHEKAEHC